MDMFNNDTIATTATTANIDPICWGTAISNTYERTTNKALSKKYKFPGVVTDNKGNKVYIKEVIYSDPATIVFWNDGTKTICKAAESDAYNPEAGLAICILKKVLGNTAVHNLFDSWCCFDCSEQTVRVDLSQVIKKFKK